MEFWGLVGEEEEGFWRRADEVHRLADFFMGKEFEEWDLVAWMIMGFRDLKHLGFDNL